MQYHGRFHVPMRYRGILKSKLNKKKIMNLSKYSLIECYVTLIILDYYLKR